MEELQPVLDLLGGKAGWVAAALAWMGALRTVAKPVSAALQAGFTKLLAFVQGTPETDDDAWVAKILASVPYRVAAFLLDWIASVKLPTSATLRAADKAQGTEATKVVLWLLCGMLVFGATGCGAPGQARPTALAVAYFTLADTKTLVDNAEKVYGRACALDQVSAADQAKIDAAIVKFHATFKLAVRAARANYSAITPAEVQTLADDLVLLIQRFTPIPSQ